MTGFKLEVGKFYRNRDGEVLKISSAGDHNPYAYKDSRNRTYTRSGSYRTNGHSAFDLIEEVERPAEVETPEQARTEFLKELTPGVYDNVQRPSHYNAGPVETIDFIRSVMTPEEFRGWLKGNWLKYKDRAENKNGAEDHSKAQFYKEFLMHVIQPEKYADPRANRK